MHLPQMQGIGGIMKKLYLLLALTGIPFMVYGQPRTLTAQARISPAAIQTINRFLTLDENSASQTEFALRLGQAQQAAATVPGTIGTLYMQQIKQKEAGAVLKARSHLAQITGQSTHALQTTAGHDHVIKEITDTIGTFQTVAQKIAQQVKNGPLQAVSFKEIDKKVATLQSHIDTFAQTYKTDANNLHVLQNKLNHMVLEPLADATLAYIAKAATYAIPEFKKNMSIIDVGAHMQLRSVIPLFEKSQVRTMITLLAKQLSHNKNLTAARKAVTGLYSTLTGVMDTAAHFAQADKERRAQYGQTYRTALDYAQQLVTIVGDPVEFVYDNSAKNTVKSTPMIKQQLDAYTRQFEQLIVGVTLTDAQPVTTQEEVQDPAKKSSSRRSMLGVSATLALIALYEFVIADKLGTKKLGLTDMFNRVMQGKKADIAPTNAPAQDNIPEQEKRETPGFLKRLGFDFLLSLFGL